MSTTTLVITELNRLLKRQISIQHIFTEGGSILILYTYKHVTKWNHYEIIQSKLKYNRLLKSQTNLSINFPVFEKCMRFIIDKSII